MSVEIWPRLPPEQLEIAIAETKRRELEWLLNELHDTLKTLKAGLEDCYALLAPIDPGSTLVLSTSRNELVKGHISRVGTRIVKGTITIKLKTLPPQTLTINPAHPIHLQPLTALHSILTHSIDVLGLTMQYAYEADPSGGTRAEEVKGAAGADRIPPSSSPNFIATQLRLLAQSLAEASALLKGPPVGESDPTWTTRSAAPSHFVPPLAPLNGHGSSLHHASSSSALSTLSHLTGVGGSHDKQHFSHVKSAERSASGQATPNAEHEPFDPPALSFHLSIQEGSLVLWLRSLEPADAPVHFGTKLALAIGTARRLEHDEADQVFTFCCDAADSGSRPHTPSVRRPSLDLPSSSAADEGNAAPARRMSTVPRPQSPKSGFRMATAAAARVGAAAHTGSQHTGNAFSGWGKAKVESEKPPRPSSAMGGADKGNEVSVYVREKVRVESADPSLLSLAAKLTALGHTLGLARRNLAAVMGEELED